MKVCTETLKRVLSKMYGKAITRADYQIEEMQGGSASSVQLITGTAETGGGNRLPYKVILKAVKKADCPVDPNSWRREYDLLKSGFGNLFTDTLRWPMCFHAEMNDEETETQLWLEYVDGVSGDGLTAEMFERAAYEIGRFQGRLYAEQPPVLQKIPNLSKPDIKKGYYFLRRTQKLYGFIRSDNCGIPKHLCKMLIDMDENADDLWNRIEQLPAVLCHRDVWMENIFYSDGKVTLIDWDTAGWGYLGEDIACLIADEADHEYMLDRYRRCVPAYYKGFSEYADISHISDHCIPEQILLMYGYKLVEWYLKASEAGWAEAQTLNINTLQKIYEIRGSLIR
ncbi:MAG: aminoglycoside phosphotransferase family protein [Oscillospiraceae bacterium]|nr:aminoglycoside phosphotransferase family protein [Oscillospiraceae bacterium]